MRSLRISLLLFFVFVGALATYAGVPPPPPTTGGPGCWPPPCIPIDGGISLLVLAGAAYGLKKISASRKGAKNPS